MDLKSRLIQNINGFKLGAAVFSLLLIGTSCLVCMPRVVHPAHSTFTVTHAGPISLHSALSQSAFVENESGTAYLTLTIDPPTAPTSDAKRVPVDMVVVLDRSGSMSDSRKLPYAKTAIRDLVNRLTPDDRFALVTFDNGVRIESPLSYATAGWRERIFSSIDSLTPGGSTDISAGLETAHQILSESGMTRQRKVMLLSDGEANAGIIDQHGLNQIAKRFTNKSSALSTIGLGLGFNEVLLSQMADNGMGSYNYLENLEQLGVILARNLDSTRQVMTAKSFIDLRLEDGVRLVDAGGYPIERVGNTIKVPVGEILHGVQKKLVLTMNLPTNKLGGRSIGSASLMYAQGNDEATLSFPSSVMAYQIVPPVRRQEAVASIDEESFRNAWLYNNRGAMQRKVHEYIKEGRQSDALSAISSYEREKAQVGASSNIALSDSNVDHEVAELKSKVSDAFVGSAPEQDDKRNRLSKKQHAESILNQRK